MSPFKEHIINVVAGAAVLGAGTTVIGIKMNDARQDQRIERIEKLSDNVNGLREDLDRVDKHLSVVDGRMQQRDLDEERDHAG